MITIINVVIFTLKKMWTWKELKCAYLPRVYLEFPFQGQPAEHFRAFPSRIFFFWDGLFLLYGCDTTVVWQCILVFFLFTRADECAGPVDSVTLPGGMWISTVFLRGQSGNAQENPCDSAQSLMEQFYK